MPVPAMKWIIIPLKIAVGCYALPILFMACWLDWWFHWTTVGNKTHNLLINIYEWTVK